MQLPFFIARRYLLSRKSHHVINWISGISAVVVAFVSLAMVVVLSAFNGIEGLVLDLYNSLEAEVEICPQHGKVFSDDRVWEWVQEQPEVLHAERSLSGEGLLRYNREQWVVQLRGVENGYADVVPLDSVTDRGNARWQGTNEIILGAGIHYYLELPSPERGAVLSLLTVPRGRSLYRSRENAFASEQVSLRGVFTVNAEYDLNWAYVPLSLLQELLGYSDGQYSAVELRLKTGEDPEAFARRLEAHFQGEVEVLTRKNRHAVIYQTSQTEKWITYLILLFILIVAGFNIVASLTMLMLDKRRDIAVLRILGFTQRDVLKTYFYQSLMINFAGGLVGILLGVAIVVLQDAIGFVPLSGSVVEYYPVKLEWVDLSGILLGILGIGLVSYFPVQYLFNRLRLSYARI